VCCDRLSYHPHIVTVYDFGSSEQGLLFIVMELLKGKALDVVLVRFVAWCVVITCSDCWCTQETRAAKVDPLSELECIALAVPVLEALEAAHTHDPPIIHRDLVRLAMQARCRIA